MNGRRGWYGITYSTCSWPTEEEKAEDPGKLFVFFAKNGKRKKAYFRDPIRKALGELGIKRLTKKVMGVIEKTVPVGTVTFRTKLVSSATVYSIHPDHIERWAERVVESLEKNKEVGDVHG